MAKARTGKANTKSKVSHGSSRTLKGRKAKSSSVKQGLFKASKLVLELIQRFVRVDTLLWNEREQLYIQITSPEILGVCPFCGGAGMKVHILKNLFLCRECGARGDSVAAYMKLTGKPFHLAVKNLYDSVRYSTGYVLDQVVVKGLE